MDTDEAMKWVSHAKNSMEVSGDQYGAEKLAEAVDALRAELAALKDRLDGAAKSLETISKQAGRDEYMETMSDVRAYAASRAMVASGEFARLCGEE